MTSRKLLLISNSTCHGSGYLDHCAGNMERLLGDEVERIAFVPYAKNDIEGYTKTARARFHRMGYRLTSVHEGDGPKEVIEKSDALFIGGGNTFLLLKRLRENGLIDLIRARVLDNGMLYMGTSAGSNVACPTIKTTNDMPIVDPGSFEGLDLVPFNINPHYIEPAPGSKHMGETREMRIREFHQHNDDPVLGLREGAMINISGDKATLLGKTGAKLFEKDREPWEFDIGSDLSFLL